MGLQPFEVKFGISNFCRFTKCWKYENSSETSKVLNGCGLDVQAYFCTSKSFLKLNLVYFYILFGLFPPVVFSALCKIKKK